MHRASSRQAAKRSSAQMMGNEIPVEEDFKAAAELPKKSKASKQTTRGTKSKRTLVQDNSEPVQENSEPVQEASTSLAGAGLPKISAPKKRAPKRTCAQMKSGGTGLPDEKNPKKTRTDKKGNGKAAVGLPKKITPNEKTTQQESRETKGKKIRVAKNFDSVPTPSTSALQKNILDVLDDFYVREATPVKFDFQFQIGEVKKFKEPTVKFTFDEFQILFPKKNFPAQIMCELGSGRCQLYVRFINPEDAGGKGEMVEKIRPKFFTFVEDKQKMNRLVNNGQMFPFDAQLKYGTFYPICEFSYSNKMIKFLNLRKYSPLNISIIVIDDLPQLDDPDDNI